MMGRQSQRGAVLVIAMIMLVLLTLFALSAFQTGSMNLRTTTNMQMRDEAQNVAQQTIDTVISSSQFTADPANALLNPCATPNTACFDVTGRGTTDYTVRLTPRPSCIKAAPISTSDIDLTDNSQLACLAAQPQGFGIAGVDTAAQNSLCSNTIWDITAEASSILGAKVTINQGVGVQVARDDVLAFCL